MTTNFLIAAIGVLMAIAGASLSTAYKCNSRDDFDHEKKVEK